MDGVLRMGRMELCFALHAFSVIFFIMDSILAFINRPLQLISSSVPECSALSKRKARQETTRIGEV